MLRTCAQIICNCFLAGLLLTLSAPFSPAQNAATGMTAEARTYLTDVLDRIQAMALNKSLIDWKRVREETFARAGNAQTTSDTYVAIAHALSQLQENHSLLQLPDNLDTVRKQAIQAEMTKELVAVRGPRAKRARSPFAEKNEMDGHIVRRDGKVFAYVVVPQCMGPYSEWQKNTPHFEEFTKKLKAIMSDLLAQKPDGWIVDLRGNHGGNMWPMLAGIGVLLGEDELGSFHNPDGTSFVWLYKNGRAGQIRRSAAGTVPAKTSSSQELPWVAVLIDRETASSGEAVAIAFAGRPRARSFGEHTAGFSTANDTVQLSDGAMLLLCVSVEADRTGRVYKDGVDPDVVLPAPESRPAEEADAVVLAAQDWLSSQVRISKPAALP